MTLVYADSSAIARAYLADEPEHDELRAFLLESNARVVTSELVRVELASAVQAAGRSGRRRGWLDLLMQIELDCGERAVIELLALRPKVVFESAYRLVLQHRVRTLDAIHLAVALEECPLLDDDVVFVTRDADQAAAAAAVGLALA